MAELSPILAELEALYPKLVATYTEPLHHLSGYGSPEPEVPVIILASKGRKRTQTGWYNPSKWVDSQEDVLSALAGLDAEQRANTTRAEIVLATELLDDPVATAAELLRQTVVHYYSQTTSYRPTDIVGAQGYYPQRWASWAFRYGFRASVNPGQASRGWSLWEPQDRVVFSKWVQENMNTGVFEVSRNSDATLKRAGSRMKKWECDCTVIRSATKVTATCYTCNKAFHWAEKELPPNALYYTGDDGTQGALAAAAQEGA